MLVILETNGMKIFMQSNIPQQIFNFYQIAQTCKHTCIIPVSSVQNAVSSGYILGLAYL